MRDDYHLNGPTKKLEVELEQSVAEQLTKMEGYTKLSRSEILNTAMKRFITAHKDFLPPEEARGPNKT